jgi:hypothetical protein
MVMEFFIRENGFVIPAAVEYEVDGITQRLHDVRVPIVWG